MNRTKGLFGLSVVAGVIGATGLLVGAGAGTAATLNTDAAYGVQAAGTSAVGSTPAVSTTTGSSLAEVGSVPAAATNGGFSVAFAAATSGNARAASTVSGFRMGFPEVTLDVETTCRHGRATVVVSGAVNGTYTAQSEPVELGAGTTATFHVPATQDEATGAVGAVISQPGLGTTIRLGYAVCAPVATSVPTEAPLPTSPATPTPTGTTSPAPPSSSTPLPTDTEPPTPSPTTTSLPVAG